MFITFFRITNPNRVFYTASGRRCSYQQLAGIFYLLLLWDCLCHCFWIFCRRSTDACISLLLRDWNHFQCILFHSLYSALFNVIFKALSCGTSTLFSELLLHVSQAYIRDAFTHAFKTLSFTTIRAYTFFLMKFAIMVLASISCCKIPELEIFGSVYSLAIHRQASCHIWYHSYWKD